MKILKSSIILSLLIMVLYACSTEPEVDTVKPEIDLNISGAFPVNCDTLYFGEPYVIKAKLTDNVELGSYNIDIHNNFDHHAHTTEVLSCDDLEPIKETTNPYVFIEDFTIPEGRNEYTTNLDFTIPSTDNDGNEYQDGDYHFHINVTDKQGWSVQKGLSIKIKRR